MAANENHTVVHFAFRKVAWKHGRRQKKGLKSEFDIEVLGDMHNLNDLAEAMFKFYFYDILQEELWMHLWRFEPCNGEDSYGQALNKKVPILSVDMGHSQMFDWEHPHGEVEVPVQTTILGLGSELIFCYDEGCPTYAAVTIEGIYPMPADRTVESYPCLKVRPKATRKRRRVENNEVVA